MFYLVKRKKNHLVNQTLIFNAFYVKKKTTMFVTTQNSVSLIKAIFTQTRLKLLHITSAG